MRQRLEEEGSLLLLLCVLSRSSRVWSDDGKRLLFCVLGCYRFVQGEAQEEDMVEGPCVAACSLRSEEEEYVEGWLFLGVAAGSFKGVL